MRRLSLLCVSSLFLLAPAACADDKLSGSGEGDESGTDTGSTDPTSSEVGSNSDSDPGDGDGDDPATATASGDGDGDDPSTTDPSTTSGDGDGDDPSTGDGDGDEPPPPDTLVRFISMGDAGEGNDGQYNVASAIEAVCADKGGCEFVIYLGDNFYDDGVSSVDDDQFQTKFELPYADLDMPFYVAMGNHDYGELSFIWEKLAYEVEYTNYSDKWVMLDKWYTVIQYPLVDFFVMDTTRLMWNHETGAQQNWLDTAIANSDKRWKIAYGHHPYYSNGQHGNAGNYEGLPWPPQAAGTDVKEVMDESLCGAVDLYFAGHDHNRQWNQQTCNGAGGLETSFIVSGAGCKTTDFAYHDDNPVYWENDTIPGFMVVELTYDSIHTEFYDENGNFEFERDIVK